MGFLKNTRMLVLLAMLVALNIVLTRFLSIEVPTQRVSLHFLPIALSAIFFGPIPAAIAAMVADVVGFALFARGAFPFFPGFTLSQFIMGAIYGLVLYQKPINMARVSVAALLVTLIVNMGFNTLWVSILTGNPFVPMLLFRAPVNVVMFGVQVLMITVSWRYLHRLSEEGTR